MKRSEFPVVVQRRQNLAALFSVVRNVGEGAWLCIATSERRHRLSVLAASVPARSVQEFDVARLSPCVENTAPHVALCPVTGCVSPHRDGR